MKRCIKDKEKTEYSDECISSNSTVMQSDFEGSNTRQRQYTSSTISNEHIRIHSRDFIVPIPDNSYKNDCVYSDDLSISSAAKSVPIEIQANLRLAEECSPDYKSSKNNNKDYIKALKSNSVRKLRKEKTLLQEDDTRLDSTSLYDTTKRSTEFDDPLCPSLEHEYDSNKMS